MNLAIIIYDYIYIKTKAQTKRRPSDCNFNLGHRCASLTICMLQFLRFAASTSFSDVGSQACVAHQFALLLFISF